MTEYLILSRDANGYWHEMSRENARSADAAIRSFADGTEAPDGTTFVGIPVRSWRPCTVAVEQTVRVSLTKAAA